MNSLLGHPHNSPQRIHERHSAGMLRPVGGFTLPELMITIAIAGILATLAAPSFSALIAEQRAKSTATDLVLALTLARSEAIKRNASVTVSANDDDWKNGWQISAAGAGVLDSHGAAPAKISIEADFSGTGSSVIYQSSGRLDPALTGTVSFTITSSQSASGYRCVTTDLSGRPNTKKTSPCP